MDFLFLDVHVYKTVITKIQFFVNNVYDTHVQKSKIGIDDNQNVVVDKVVR